MDAIAVLVHPPELELRAGVTLLGREAIPGDRFGVILWDATTGSVNYPEVILRAGMALLSGLCETR